MIRSHGLKYRIKDPQHFLRDMNKLCIEMTHARKKAGAPKMRKKIFRRMKKVLLNIFSKKSPVMGQALNSTGQLKALFLLNVTIDATPPLTLTLRGCHSSTMTWIQPETDSQNINVIQHKNDTQVIIPSIPPWSEGFLIT